ncbi:MAG: MltA domain-containing protein [Burkholderiales bacterium]
MNDPVRKIQFCKIAAACALAAIITACETPKPPPAKPVAAPLPAVVPESSSATPPTVKTDPDDTPRILSLATWSDLPGWQQDNHAEALPALLASCRVLAKQLAWQDACEAAPAAKGRDAAKRFFEAHFLPYRVAGAEGSSEGLITGYYEPTLRGSRKPSARNRFPVYGVPDDLLVVDLGELAPELKSTAPRARLEGRRVVPYFDRAQIENGRAPVRGKEIAWVEDAVELFFLQIQGSGRITLDDGTTMRVGFAEHNGHPYRSIGRVLIDRGELPLERTSMQGIKAWARDNPAKLTELLYQNPRFVFFRELPANGMTPSGAGVSSPPGALGVPLTPQRSIAVDPRYVPLGAPVHIATTWPNTNKPLQRLMLAQDTGGAIRGAVRADFFWGSGEEATREAGRMKQPLRMWVLLPKNHPSQNNIQKQ